MMMSSLSVVPRRGGRHSRGSPQWEDDTPPHTCVMTAIVLLVHVRGHISLQDESAKTAADQPANCDLALLRVVCKRFVEIGRAEGDDTKLPRVELPGHGQIDVEEVRVAALDGEWRRTWRQLRTPVRDMGELRAPDDIGGQVPLVAG